MRKIKIIGAIDEDSFKEFCDQLDALEKFSKADVAVELSSSGGNAYDALAFAARIRLSPCRIIITAFGYVASAAVLILAAGDWRRMTKEAWVMVHEDSGKIQGDVVKMERDAAHYRRMENQWATLLKQNTTTSEEEWTKLHRAETYLCAGECKDLGLVDEVA